MIAFKPRHLFAVPFSLVSCLAVFYTTWCLKNFLSSPAKISIQQKWIVNLLDDFSRIQTALLPLTIDAILIIVFILVHSLLCIPRVKLVFMQTGLVPIQRSFYNLVTAGSLWLLMNKWKTVPSLTLWNFDVESDQVVHWTFIIIHYVAWAIVYGGVLMMDLPELCGVKDVYYDLCQLGVPLVNKSEDLVVLYAHIRHPSFVCFSVILWFTNIMTFDRLMLAFMWTIYMKLAWRTDDVDIEYQREQRRIKKNELLQK